MRTMHIDKVVRIILIAGLSVLGACRIGYDPLIEQENSADSGSTPAFADAAEIDAASDAMPDAASDAMPDAAPDAMPDAMLDAAPDAMPDAMPDAAPDARPPTLATVVSGVASTGLASEDVSIAPVNLNQSFVMCSWRDSSDAPEKNLVRCQLDATNNVRIRRDVDSTSADVAWQVVSLPGMVVQRGTISVQQDAPNPSITINTVDLGRAFVLVTSSAAYALDDDDESTVFMASLSDSTTLSLKRGDIKQDTTVDWQVIEMPASFVQSGITTMADVNTSAIVPLNAAVDASRTFVIFSTELDSSVDGIESAYRTRAKLSPGGTAITFTRRSTGSDVPLNFAWYAVQLPMGSAVYHLGGSTAAPHESTVENISDSALNPSMFAYSSVEIDSSNTDQGTLDASSLTTRVGNATVQLERNDVSTGDQLLFETTVVDIVIP